MLAWIVMGKLARLLPAVHPGMGRGKRVLAAEGAIALWHGRKAMNAYAPATAITAMPNVPTVADAASAGPAMDNGARHHDADGQIPGEHGLVPRLPPGRPPGAETVQRQAGTATIWALRSRRAAGDGQTQYRLEAGPMAGPRRRTGWGGGRCR